VISYLKFINIVEFISYKSYLRLESTSTVFRAMIAPDLKFLDRERSLFCSKIRAERSENSERERTRFSLFASAPALLAPRGFAARRSKIALAIFASFSTDFRVKETACSLQNFPLAKAWSAYWNQQTLFFVRCSHMIQDIWAGKSLGRPYGS